MGRVEPVGPTPMITLVLNANNIASDIKILEYSSESIFHQ